MSCLWKQFQDKMFYQKTFEEEKNSFFLFLVGDFNITDIFYKI